MFRHPRCGIYDKICQTKKQTEMMKIKKAVRYNAIYLIWDWKTENHEAVIRKSHAFTHILCFANDSELTSRTAYECKHSTQVCWLIRTAFKS